MARKVFGIVYDLLSDRDVPIVKAARAAIPQQSSLSPVIVLSSPEHNVARTCFPFYPNGVIPPLLLGNIY
jgi:hypothetical protein